MYSPLEQFEFSPITFIGPKNLTQEFVNLFFNSPEFFNYNIPVYNLPEGHPIYNLFLNEHFLNYKNNMPAVIIEGIYLFPQEFVIQQLFITDFFYSKIAINFWELCYYNVVSPTLDNEDKILTIMQKYPAFYNVYLVSEDIFGFYCQITNPDLELDVINILNEDIKRPATKEEILEMNLFDTNKYFTIYWLNIYTSIGIVMVIYYFAFIICNTLISIRHANIWVLLIDLLLNFLFTTYKSLVHEKLYHYFPIFFTLFMLVFISNLTALIPFSFCLTSNLWFTLTLSLTVWVGVTILAINVRGKEFFLAFVPANVPSALKPFLTVIEIISYIARAISLGVRIFANMLAGHSLIHILADLVENCVLSFGNVGFKIFGIFPAIILIFIVFIEFGICFLQALVFVILTAIYLNEAFGFNAH